jgi:hypothetical protein
MPVDLTQLTPEFQAKVQPLLEQCDAAGYTMQPNEGLRPPSVQAKYWRQSRTTDQITAEIAKLNASGAPWLANCIDTRSTPTSQQPSVSPPVASGPRSGTGRTFSYAAPPAPYPFPLRCLKLTTQ